MKLLGVHLSPFVRKVAVVLTHKGIAYEHEPIMPGSESPEFRELSPLGKIPVLVDGDFSVADSTAICEYLEEKYPQPAMLPASLEDRARARFLEEYGDSKFIEAAAVIFLEVFANPNIFGKETDPERVAIAQNETLPSHLDYLESQVPQEGFLFGDFCTADISIATPMFQAAYGGYTIDAERWPRYAAYVQRVTEHPAVARVRELEQQALAKMRGG